MACTQTMALELSSQSISRKSLHTRASSPARACVRACVRVLCLQAAEVTCQTIAQYLDKYAEEFSVHTADRFFHKAFCLAHQVSLSLSVCLSVWHSRLGPQIAGVNRWPLFGGGGVRGAAHLYGRGGGRVQVEGAYACRGVCARRQATCRACLRSHVARPPLAGGSQADSNGCTRRV